jgi:hypothetical protein
MGLPVLAQPVVAERTSSRPEGITILGGFAFLAGIMLLIAVITFALPFSGRWDYGPAFIGAWIILGFGYAPFGQFLPPIIGYAGFGQVLPTIWFTIIVILATLYLATGIGFFTGRRWAWILGIALASVGGASGILQTIALAQYGFGFYAVPGLTVAILALVYLATPIARDFFFKRR